MIKIKLIRNIKREDLVKEYKSKYENMENLKKLTRKNPNDVNLDLDLDEWIYSIDHPDEILEQQIIIYDEKPSFSMTDLQILDLIKNEKPSSISELAEMMGKDNGNIAKQVNKLKEKGFIELSTGNINNIKTPVFNYDKIEIAI